MRSAKAQGLRTVAAGAVLAAVVTLVPFQNAASAWDTPGGVRHTENPLRHVENVVADGKTIYEANCAVCHDDRGRGRGPAAVALTPRPKPFSDRHVAAQADWALFWKITHGRAPMPAWGQMLTEEQRWSVIHYIHTLMGSARPKRGS